MCVIVLFGGEIFRYIAKKELSLIFVYNFYEFHFFDDDVGFVNNDEKQIVNTFLSSVQSFLITCVSNLTLHRTYKWGKCNWVESTGTVSARISCN